MLSSHQKIRYSRQIILPEFGEAGQKKIAAASILVIGAGGLGCPVLQYLAAAGVGRIGIVDYDKVMLSNLHRQILYNEADIGKPKAAVARIKIAAINSEIKITSHEEKVNHNNIDGLITGYDIIVDGTDNFETRYLINDACRKMMKPLIYGSVFKFEGQVSVFNYNGGPDYRTLFPEAGNSENCENAGVAGILPGITGTLMANEVIKIILETEGILSGKLLMMNALNFQIRIYSFI